MPLVETFCKLLMEGKLPNVVSDTTTDEQVQYLDLTDEANIGSYVGVPLRFSDGRLYGTLCTYSHSPDPSLKERDAQFMRVLARMVAEQLEREELEAQKQRFAVELAGLQALLAALEARDGYSGEHSKTVMDLSVEVAQQMNLPEAEGSIVRQAALLHDIGKIRTPDSILKKSGTLTDIEMEMIRKHTAIGARMVASLEGLAPLAPIIRASHEHWDGKGYPDGLPGEEIPLASRIVHACDAWHAMSSDRPYRKALSAEEVIEQLKKSAGTQFDPGVVSVLMAVLKSHHLRPPR